MTDEETITACPECDSGRLRRRVTDQKEHRYKCKDCSHTFNEPVERCRKATGPGADVMLERVVDDADKLREATGL